MRDTDHSQLRVQYGSDSSIKTNNTNFRTFIKNPKNVTSTKSISIENTPTLPDSVLAYSTLDRNKPSFNKKTYLQSTQIRDYAINKNKESNEKSIEKEAQTQKNQSKSLQRFPDILKDKYSRNTTSIDGNNIIDVDYSYKAKSDASKQPVPTIKELSAKEEYLIKQYPKLIILKENLKTLNASEVEEIESRKSSNPSNVKRVEFILPEENYNELFPMRHFSYTYKRLLQVPNTFNKL